MRRDRNYDKMISTKEVLTMERIRELDRYPKLLLLLLVVMAVGFCAVYGFAYLFNIIKKFAFCN